MNDRDKLPYTVAFILETLRFYPIVPVGLPHKTASDTEAGKLKNCIDFVLSHENLESLAHNVTEKFRLY